jgi:hypothetical protein
MVEADPKTLSQRQRESARARRAGPATEPATHRHRRVDDDACFNLPWYSTIYDSRIAPARVPSVYCTHRFVPACVLCGRRTTLLHTVSQISGAVRLRCGP